MFVTSMGIFGFLSKAHLDQAVPTGDVVDKIAIIDEKIKTQKENIDASRKVLKQMDDSVDQLMSRTTDERGAVRSSALRKSQQKERDQLRLDIETAQHTVQQLNEQKAPLAKEIRQVEAEVGPIKYIAAFFYGSTDQTVLEKAVTWVIIVLISVFDPLAVILLLASQVSFDNLRNRNKEEETAPVYEPDDGPLTDDQVEQIKELAKEDLPEGELIVKDELFPEEDHHSIDHRSLIIDHWVKLAKSKRVKMADIPPEYLAEVKPRV
jgi:hypothetical protein